MTQAVITLQDLINRYKAINGSHSDGSPMTREELNTALNAVEDAAKAAGLGRAFSAWRMEDQRQFADRLWL